MSGEAAAAWEEFCALVAAVRSRPVVRLGCWCGAAGGECAASCHAWVVRAAVLWFVGA